MKYTTLLLTLALLILSPFTVSANTPRRLSREEILTEYEKELGVYEISLLTYQVSYCPRAKAGEPLDQIISLHDWTREEKDSFIREIFLPRVIRYCFLSLPVVQPTSPQ